MHILRSWYDSLALLLPSQLSLFILVSLLSTYKTFLVLLRAWPFWLFTAGLAVWGYFDQVMVQPYWCLVFTSGVECFFKKFIWHFCAFILALMLVLLTCAATRPSISLKNMPYFYSLMHKAVKIIAVLVAVQCIGYSIMAIDIPWVSSLATVFLVADWVEVDCILYVLFILFVLDAEGTFSSLFDAAKRTVIMLVYNLPLFIIFNLASHAVQGILLVLLKFLSLDTSFFAWFPLWLVTMPLLVNIWANIYIKKLHEHPDLYFVTPK